MYFLAFAALVAAATFFQPVKSDSFVGKEETVAVSAGTRRGVCLQGWPSLLSNPNRADPNRPESHWDGGGGAQSLPVEEEGVKGPADQGRMRHSEPHDPADQKTLAASSDASAGSSSAVKAAGPEEAGDKTAGPAKGIA